MLVTMRATQYKSTAVKHILIHARELRKKDQKRVSAKLTELKDILIMHN